MTLTTANPALDAVILDYNGVIGLQPGAEQWRYLARLANWPDDDITSFQNAFWSAREAYDAGQLSDLAYWARVLGYHPGPRMLRELRAADTAMWTHTDDRVLAVLHNAHRRGLPMVLLSNAPHPLSDVLDTHDWCRRLMTRALYSARLEVCKPDPAAYRQALDATGAADPQRVLFIDDRADNCRTAARLGLRTLHYTGQPAHLEAALLPRTS
ncbi:HAD family phosphatase [Streptomyces ipomoeae]|uniref:HAD family hydrolase n=1 Tax=Streptomyces ipomoeae TaxID=103232 RepID=UPI0029AC6196|nr:HAD family phosphatase [Streptomyces ipomoeae]MDX2819907.1 HAD family phosphatase [Streptomyces ipomoeae]MDX2872648.1 HAD family phosphatase [Streptomyces ipomoeae]